MTNETEFLWYIPNDVKAGHRGDTAVEGHNNLDCLTAQAEALEKNGWRGALIGTGWAGPIPLPSRPHSSPEQKPSSR